MQTTGVQDDTRRWDSVPAFAKSEVGRPAVFLRAMQGQVYRFAYLLSGSQADATFATALTFSLCEQCHRAHDPRLDANPETWLILTAHLCATGRPTAEGDGIATVFAADLPGYVTDGDADRDCLLRALRALDPAERALLGLHLMVGCGLSTATMLVGESPSAGCRLLAAALSHLRGEWEDHRSLVTAHTSWAFLPSRLRVPGLYSP
ncbi:MAG: RNA polymerase sigma factor [Candidatus Dormibacteria bacterium]